MTSRFRLVVEQDICKVSTLPARVCAEPHAPARERVFARSWQLVAVEREDEVIVESVRRRVRSRLNQRGRYAPRRERGVHPFHHLLAREVDALAQCIDLLIGKGLVLFEVPGERLNQVLVE